MKQINQTPRLILNIFIPISEQFFIIFNLSVICFLTFLVLLNLLHSEPNTFDINGHLFTDFLRVNGSLIKIKFLISVVKLYLYKGSPIVSRDEVTVQYFWFVSLCFTWQ